MDKSLMRKITLFSKKFNIKKYLSEKAVEFKEVDSPNGRQIQVHVCPFCKSINHKGNYHPDRLYISEDTKLFLCYNCDERGNIVKLLASFESISECSTIDKYIYGDYIELLPDELKVLLLESGNNGREVVESLPPYRLPPSFLPLFPLTTPLNQYHRYLSSRGMLDVEVLEKFDIRYCEQMKRVVFPIYFEGECKGWQARDITGQQQPKYLINKGLQKQLLVFNYDNIKDKEFITITEGPVDAIKSHRINGTCLFGKSLSQTQERYLLKCTNLKTVYLCLDQDEGAQQAQSSLAQRLGMFFRVFFIRLPTGKDAGDMSEDEMVFYMKQAVPYNTNTLQSNLL